MSDVPRDRQPNAFDDDALAAALEADMKSFTQPISIVPPAEQAPPPPEAPPAQAAPPAADGVPPAAAEPPLVSPAYGSEYEAPDVPEYVIPPAPRAPDYEVPPPPPATDYEPPPAPVFDAPTAPAPEPVAAPAPAPSAVPLFPLPEEPGAAAGGPTTLDAIQRLEDELQRRGFDTGPVPPVDAPPPAAPEPAAAPPSDATPWMPAYPIPESLPAPDPEPRAEEWASAPAPAPVEPPPLVEPIATTPPVTPIPEPEIFSPPTPPTEGATYVAPTVLPPIREVRLEDVQGLPPPIGQQAAPLPPYDPNTPVIPATASAPPAPPSAAAPSAAPAGAAPIPPVAPVVPPAAPPASSVPPGPLPGAADLPSLDELDRIDQAESDDAVDDIDRVVGDAQPGEAPYAAAGAFPSQPISTQRVADAQPGLVDHKPERHPVFVVEHAGTEPTALDLRAGRAARLFWLWFATNSSVVSLAIGAVLFSVGVSLRQAIVATLAGVALSFLPLGLGTLAGKWSGQPTMVVSRATFGHVGNVLPAFVAVLTRVFWGAVLLWLLATSVGELLEFAGLDVGMGAATWTFVVLGVGALLTAVIALFGYGFVALLQLISSIVSGLLIAGLIYITWPHLDLDAALAVGDGAWTLVLGGAVLVFSFVGLAWVQSSADVARYQRTGSSGAQSMLWAATGATLPPFALIAWGAMLAASDPQLADGLTTSPLTTIARLVPLWYPAPLIAAAGLGLLSSIVLTMYSGGFALQALGIRARRSITTLVAAVLVAVLAVGLVVLNADAFGIVRDLATTLAVPVAAWAGIFAAEMMIRTRRFDSPSLLAPGGVYPQVRVANLVGFVLITALAFGFTSATFPGLTWQGYLFGPLGIALEDPFARSDVGVFIALLLGIILPLATAIPAIRRQERESLKAEHTGPIPRITGAVPRATGAVPTPEPAPQPAAAPPIGEQPFAPPPAAAPVDAPPPRLDG